MKPNALNEGYKPTEQEMRLLALSESIRSMSNPETPEEVIRRATIYLKFIKSWDLGNEVV